MDTAVTNPIEMGKSIVDFSFIVMTAAVYLVYSGAIIFFFVRWFVRVIDGIIERQQQVLDEIHRLLIEMYDRIKTFNNEFSSNV